MTTQLCARTVSARFGQRDVYSWNVHVHDLSGGASVGLKLLEDVWLSLGYNVVGFRDRDFTGGYTAQGPFLRFRFRFNQDSKHEMVF